MSITNKESLGIINGVGYFFILVVISTLYSRDDITIKALLIGGGFSIPLIALATCYWKQKLSYQSIESSFGALFFAKNKVYSNLLSIELYVAVIEVENAADGLSLSIAMEIADRNENLELLTKVSWSKCSGTEIVNEINEISKVTGVTVINASPQFKQMFQRQFNKEFSLS
ncbi:hypothetical protein [Thalassotalea sp. Y01]|uniref:hypothetical protein n=1 Tax=Thalassotalea sp. Y01 TaxID=2729613 RepID=UPI00145C9063|nr:hypothetical protein [Thalassotalea sp. Y01]NMP15370.1 hypothetical protein [Thalassotalea sp. Y01]